MMRILCFVVTAFLFLGITGVCSNTVMVQKFCGKIGDRFPIHMTLIHQGEVLTGTYFYYTIGKEIQLKGTHNAKGNIVLTEYDASGKSTGVFEGKFVSSNTFEGAWSTPDGKKSMPFRLWNPTDTVSGQYQSGQHLTGKGDAGATLNVELQKDKHVKLQGDAVWIGNADTGNVNVGETEGAGLMNGKRVDYVEDKGNPDSCRFTIVFGIDSLTVKDDTLQCGGLNVSFDGEYKRVGAPEFESEK